MTARHRFTPITLLRPVASERAWKTACRYALTCALLTLVCGIPANAEGEPYQAYPLRHKQVADVEPQLFDLLRNLDPAPHIAADQRNNQLLIRGSEQAQQIARQFLQSVDRPPVAGTATPANNIVRGYTLPPDQLAAATGRLQNRFGNLPDVRVTSDIGTSQIIVLAPPEIQAVIARELAGAARPPVSDRRPGPTQPQAAPSKQFVRLAHAPLARIESQLRHLLGPQIEPTGGQQAGQPDYVFVNQRSRRVEFTFDWRGNGITLLGDAPVVSQLTRLITALDALEGDRQTTGETLRILPVRRANPAKIQEAVDAYRTGRKQGPTAPAGPATRETGHWGGPPANGVAQAQFNGPPNQLDPQAPGAAPLPALGEEVPVEREAEQRLRELGDRVDIESLPDLDVMILRGRDADVDEVSRIIAEIERLSAETIPEIDIYELRTPGSCNH